MRETLQLFARLLVIVTAAVVLSAQPAQSQIWNCNFWFDCYVDCGDPQEVEWIETYCEDENGNPVHHSYTTTGYCCYSW